MMPTSPNFKIEEHRRRFALNITKMIFGCASCGFNDHAHALTFHHREPQTKSFNVSHGVARYSPALVRDEIEKCDLMCANCHQALPQEVSS